MQKLYWVQHSADLSVEAMMLDSKAAHLDKEERPEVFSLSLSLLSFNLCFTHLAIRISKYSPSTWSLIDLICSLQQNQQLLYCSCAVSFLPRLENCMGYTLDCKFYLFRKSHHCLPHLCFRSIYFTLLKYASEVNSLFFLCHIWVYGYNCESN